MNFQKVQRKNRKAISPVLATVILIAITLIAAIAIAGFVFGLFGTFTSSATLTINSSTVTCAAPAGTSPDQSWACTMNVQNTGSGASSITGVGPAGWKFTGAVTSVNIPANSVTPVAVTLTSTGAAPTNFASGQTVSGYLVVSSGANLAYTVVLP